MNELGGRIPLIGVDDLDGDQRGIHEVLSGLVVPESEHGDFLARTADGRFVGPFNAMLRNPAVTRGFGALTAAVGAAGLSPEVREAVILTVGAAWRADYEVYAHTRAAAAEGLPRAAVESILAGEEPSGLGVEATAAQRLASGLVQRQEVPAAVYAEAVHSFSEGGVVSLLGLIAQYQMVSSILVCFDVPVPTDRLVEEQRA
ncbi:carboxymuconolactone decarboxylase family protein [Nocardioides marmoraquaticus]